jgi:8-oxo-dGTP pyrophosphatase MutT (NUDIX family)
MKEKIGGWKQKSAKVMYENPWIEVSHQEVVRPNGSEGIYGVVHFKGTAVGVVPIDSEGNTWLVRQSRYTLDTYTWEIPEGGAKAGEDTKLTAARELEEEIGVCARDIRELMRMHLSNSVTDEEAVVYVAEDLYPGTQNLDATEDIEFKKLPLEEAVEMVKKGEITDAISVAALLRLALDRATSLKE